MPTNTSIIVAGGTYNVLSDANRTRGEPFTRIL